MFVSINLCVDLACTLFIQSTYPLHRQSIIHQPKSIDVVITTPRALGRWSHTDQSCNSDQILLPEPICRILQIRNPLLNKTFLQFRSDPPTSNRSVEFFRSEISYSIKPFCNSDQNSLLATNLSNSSDQKFFKQFFYKFLQHDNFTCFGRHLECQRLPQNRYRYVSRVC